MKPIACDQKPLSCAMNDRFVSASYEYKLTINVMTFQNKNSLPCRSTTQGT